MAMSDSQLEPTEKKLFSERSTEDLNNNTSSGQNETITKELQEQTVDRSTEPEKVHPQKNEPNGENNDQQENASQNSDKTGKFYSLLNP